MFLPIDEFKNIYEIEEILIEGSGSIIKRCKKKDSKESYVLKIITCKKINDIEEALSDLKSLANIRHQSIVPIIHISYEIKKKKTNYNQVVEIQEKIVKFYLVMRSLDHDLTAEIEKRKKSKISFTNSEIFYFVEKMIELLCFLQSEKLSHNNLKTNHFLLDEKNQFYLCDFASCKNLKYYDGSIPETMGYEPFLSPFMKNMIEKKNKNKNILLKEFDFYKNDVFAFGLCLLNMCSLFSVNGINDSQEILGERISDLKRKRFYEDWVYEILERCLAFEDDKRLDFFELRSLFIRRKKTDQTAMTHYIEYLESELHIERIRNTDLEENNKLLQIKLNKHQGSDGNNSENGDFFLPVSSTIRENHLKKNLVQQSSAPKIFFKGKFKTTISPSTKKVSNFRRMNSGRSPEKVITDVDLVSKENEIVFKLESLKRNLREMIKGPYFSEKENNEIKEYLENQPDDLNKADIFELQSTAYFQNNHVPEAIEAIQKAIRLRVTYSNGKGTILNEDYFKLAMFLFEFKKYDTALNNLNLILKFKVNSNEETKTIKKFKIYYWSGYCSLYIKKYDDALNYFTDCLNLIKEPSLEEMNLISKTELHNKKFKMTYSGLYLGLAITQRHKNNIELSKSFLRQGYQHIERENFEEISIYQYWFGVLENLEGRFLVSIEFLESSLKSYEKKSHKDKLFLSEIYHWVGISYHDIQDFESSLIYHEKAYKINLKELGSKNHRTLESRFWIGINYYGIQSYQKAIDLFLEVLEERSPNAKQNDSDMVYLEYWLGKCYFEITLYEYSYKFVQKCMHFFEQCHEKAPIYLMKINEELRMKLNL